MTLSQITKLQKENGYWGLQQRINEGIIWLMEGSCGRDAMRSLEAGICMLPTKPFKDAYGNTVPSRKVLKEGTKGTYLNSKNFWSRVEKGEILLDY